MLSADLLFLSFFSGAAAAVPFLVRDELVMSEIRPPVTPGPSVPWHALAIAAFVAVGLTVWVVFDAAKIGQSELTQATALIAVATVFGGLLVAIGGGLTVYGLIMQAQATREAAGLSAAAVEKQIEASERNLKEQTEGSQRARIEAQRKIAGSLAAGITPVLDRLTGGLQNSAVANHLMGKEIPSQYITTRAQLPPDIGPGLRQSIERLHQLPVQVSRIAVPCVDALAEAIESARHFGDNPPQIEIIAPAVLVLRVEIARDALINYAEHGEVPRESSLDVSKTQATAYIQELVKTEMKAFFTGSHAAAP